MKPSRARLLAALVATAFLGGLAVVAFWPAEQRQLEAEPQMFSGFLESASGGGSGDIASISVTGEPLGGTSLCASGDCSINYVSTGCVGAETWIYDGTNWQCVLPTPTAFSYDCNEDFFGVAPGSATTGGQCLTGVVAASGTISYTGATIDATHPGVVVLTSVAGAGSRATLMTSAPSSAETYVFGSGATHVIEAIVRLSNLTDATDTIVVRIGFLDSANSTATDGAWFEYTVSNTTWRCRTGAAASLTDADSTITVAATTWVKLRVEITAATTARFYIDDVQRCGDITSQIPSGSGQATQGVIQLTRPSGTPTNVRSLHVDKFRSYGILSGGR
jgi:hypothetical protein